MAAVAPSHRRKADYRIAIITALAPELSAVLAMLDDGEHEQPSDFRVRHEGDPNSYSWGTIGQHNVVITCLEAGRYGLTSATSTALYVRSQFPWIKWGLMVGIGAGIPSEDRDIRLGDVVVSHPSGNSSGVFQHDFSRCMEDKVEHIGWLAKPPQVLLRALPTLRARHLQHGTSRMQEHLGEAMRRSKYWAQTYKHPQAIDRLFPSTYSHQEGSRDCGACDPEKSIKRSSRDENDFRIHYGVIASGNSLVKNALLRDKIASDVNQCICIEMEAAGLMNDFPCLVIRGISDYADSHKNDIWQHYACATAAAFTKEFLSSIPQADFILEHNVYNTPVINRRPVGGGIRFMSPPPIHGFAITGIYNDELFDSQYIDSTGSTQRAISAIPTPQRQPSAMFEKDNGPNLPERLQFGDTISITESVGVRSDSYTETESTFEITETATPSMPLERRPSAKPNILARMQEPHAQPVLQGIINEAQQEMIDAAKTGDLASIKILYAQGASLSWTDPDGRNTLHHAAYSGHEDIITFCLDHNTDIDCPNSTGYTALLFAASGNQLGATRLLLDCGAKRAKTTDGSTIMHLAAQNNNAEVLKLILDYRVDIEAKDISGNTPLHTAVKNNHTVATTMLLNQKANLEARNNAGKTVLHAALHVKSVDLKLVEVLLARGAELEAIDHTGCTVIHAAVQGDYIEIAKLILTYGPNLEARNPAGRTVLLEAVSRNNIEMAELLLPYNANIEAKNNQGDTALHIACFGLFSNPALVRLLLDWEANPNSVGNNKLTPLHLAAENGFVEEVKFLLDAGANSKAKDKNKEKPKVMAKTQKHENVKKMLRDHEKAQPGLFSRLISKSPKENVQELKAIVLKKLET